MNKVVLLGRAIKDIEVTQTQGGTSIAKFCLAVNRPFKKDETDFINCIAFGKTAEVLAQYIKKGNQLAIHGRIQTGSYDAKDGTKRYTTDVIVEGFDFVSGGNNNQATKENSSNLDDFAGLEPIDNEDMPF